MQCPYESATPQRGIQALWHRMDPCAPPGKRGPLVQDEFGTPRDHSQESGAGSTRATTDTRSYGSHVTPRRLRRRAQLSRIESGWMSIFAPVSFAARRAFWPSLPMARDSW